MSTAMSTRSWTNERRAMVFLQWRRELDCWGAVHFFVNWRCLRNCHCNYRNEIDQSNELDDLKIVINVIDDGMTPELGDSRQALVESIASRYGQGELERFSWTSSSLFDDRSEPLNDSYVQRRWVVFGESSAEFGRDNQLDCAVSTANVMHAQKYDIATKNGYNRPENWLKLIVGDQDCHDVACQVLPHLIFLIPTLEEWEQARIAGKGDKVQILFSYSVFIPNKPIGAAPWWHFFWGGKGACGIGCYAPRAADFQEERNPPQADTILIERKLCTIRTILQYYHCNTVPSY